MQQTVPVVFGALYILALITIAIVFLTAVWRGMRAHESIARSLEGIERALSERPRPEP